MTFDAISLSSMPVLIRLALALAIGVFIGMQREQRHPEIGMRTFAFVGMLGAAAGLLGDGYALLVLALVGVLIVVLNVWTLQGREGAEIAAGAALLLTGVVGILLGKGHTFTAMAIGLATAGLLAWKEPYSNFSRALSDAEIRSALLLAILAVGVYPVLPHGTVDRWQLLDARAAWITVMAVVALGFANFILFRLYGNRSIELTGFLGGLVNSTVTVAELANRVRLSNGGAADVAFRGIVVATLAMLVRNTIILGLIAPTVLRLAAIPLLFMIAATSCALFLQGGWPRLVRETDDEEELDPLVPGLESPFSPSGAVKFALAFLALQTAGTLALRAAGALAFYTVSAAGGLVSSASAVAAAAHMAATGVATPGIAAAGAVIASFASAMLELPILARIGGDTGLTRKVAVTLGVIGLLGAIGAAAQLIAPRI